MEDVEDLEEAEEQLKKRRGFSSSAWSAVRRIIPFLGAVAVGVGSKGRCFCGRRGKMRWERSKFENYKKEHQQQQKYQGQKTL